MQRLRMISGICFSVLMLLLLTAACGGRPGPFDGRPAADLTAYEGLKGYQKELPFAETDVAEIVSLLEKGESFAFLAAFAECGHCNRMIAQLADAASEYGLRLGYLNTRKDPSWKSNLDIRDYDLFVRHFGEWLDYDDAGVKHLYVPDLFIIKEGKILGHRQGVIGGADDLSVPLTKQEDEQLRRELKEALEPLRKK